MDAESFPRATHRNETKLDPQCAPLACAEKDQIISPGNCCRVCRPGAMPDLAATQVAFRKTKEAAAELQMMADWYWPKAEAGAWTHLNNPYKGVFTDSDQHPLQADGTADLSKTWADEFGLNDSGNVGLMKLP